MDLMRAACADYDWSRSSWELLVGESFLLDPSAEDSAAAPTIFKDELGRKVCFVCVFVEWSLHCGGGGGFRIYLCWVLTKKNMELQKKTLIAHLVRSLQEPSSTTTTTIVIVAR